MANETITYSELARRVGTIFLFNKAALIDEELYYNGLENGTLYSDDEDTEENDVDIYQWYLISPSGADYLKRNTEELVFYSEVLDEYLWGITHLGTSWDYVNVTLNKA